MGSVKTFPVLLGFLITLNDQLVLSLKTLHILRLKIVREIC